MRNGYTTGSCAAAAAKAACYMLLTGQKKENISIETPGKIVYTPQIQEIAMNENSVVCAVQKDSGDDPDVTNGILIFAKVAYDENDVDGCNYHENDVADHHENQIAKVTIDGGIGIGRVTKPGLDQPVGNAAINHVPREMIEKEVLEVCGCLDFKGKLYVEIFAPEGVEIAKKTFNERLGIVGGISVLGTSGIVEPMSNQAILDTIAVELRQRRALGYDYVAISPGNYGLDFMKNAYGFDLNQSVKCSNFIGNTIDMLTEYGFKKVLLVGHIGKLIKVAGGIMNTHSKEADCRMELLSAFAIKQGAGSKTACEILECVSTEEAVRILMQAGKRQEVMDYAMERILYYLKKRAGEDMQIDCIMFANEFGELAKSKEANQWFTLLEQEPAQSI